MRSPRRTRRNPTTGTTEDLTLLELKHPKLKSPSSYHSTTTKQLEFPRLMSDKLLEAQRFHKAGRNYMCRWRCKQIIGVPECSSAIEARAYMLLAKPELTAAVVPRAAYAEMAVRCWQKVIDRKGTSRFPAEEAMKQQILAVKMLDAAELARDGRKFIEEVSSTCSKTKPSSL